MNKHQLTLAVVLWKEVFFPELSTARRRSRTPQRLTTALMNRVRPARFSKNLTDNLLHIQMQNLSAKVVNVSVVTHMKENTLVCYYAV